MKSNCVNHKLCNLNKVYAPPLVRAQCWVDFVASFRSNLVYKIDLNPSILMTTHDTPGVDLVADSGIMLLIRAASWQPYLDGRYHAT